ncbi:hypothetical protein KC19_10G101800 [Ceratodon purpureus]|uniref:Uncharacterized protein n=1 Tax=Ceratodon purpureus TaxID=3225 RepID=A0A8T0GQZ2_CERPU|nr:hypothetical protein KC19_10G101800 [Ceratodon purpureus]
MVKSQPRRHGGDGGAAVPDGSPPKRCTTSLRSIRKCLDNSRSHDDTPAPKKYKSSRFRGVTKQCPTPGCRRIQIVGMRVLDRRGARVREGISSYVAPVLGDQ